MNESHREQLIDTLNLFSLQFSMHGIPGNHMLHMNDMSELVPSDTARLLDPILHDIANVMVVLMTHAELEFTAYGFTFRLVEIAQQRFVLSVSRVDS